MTIEFEWDEQKRLSNIQKRGVGSSITASRTLPALLSLLSLPLMYSLAWELFASRQAAYLATGLLALSPFDILFAQTVRPDGVTTQLKVQQGGLFRR